ncbi:MAG: tRNA1(Val) (adenine(37)-N6)-methyltransferase [Clostridiales bacterium]|nr:tRNA1(Val) (adenine(37)-N6)-methyltransferase [Clostridiales bacterium]
MILNDDEQLHDLQNGLSIIQKNSGFRFGTDAVLLSHFAQIKTGSLVADLGCGSGIIALLIAQLNPRCHVKAVDIFEDMCDMAARSVKLNHLEDRIEVIQGDIRQSSAYFNAACFDHVVSNPPYYPESTGKKPKCVNKCSSRTEQTMDIADVCRASRRILKSRGRLSVVFPAWRYNDAIETMRDNSIEPKRVRFVHDTLKHPASIVLLEGVKQGGKELNVLPPLILHNPDGSFTEEWLEIYG